MFYLLAKWILYTLAVLFVDWIVPGVAIADFTSAMMCALVIGIVNSLIKPALEILTIKPNLPVLAILALLLNTLALIFIPNFIQGISISTLPEAIFGSIVLSITSIFINQIDF